MVTQPVEESADRDEEHARLLGFEKQFRRAGLPLFIEDFSAATDVYNRALPVLIVVFLAEVLGATQLEWSVLANIAAVIGGMLILLLAIGGINLARGRPFTALIEDVGRPELAVFVIVPALLPLIFGGQWQSAAATAAANVVLLGVIYAVIAYGLFSILRWVGARIAQQIAVSFTLLTRAVPLLLIILLIVFVNQEMWQVAASVATSSLVILGLLFVTLGTGFLFARLPREVRVLEADVGDQQRPLDRRQRRNVSVVLFVSEAFQVLTVSLILGGFFIIFGALSVTAEVREVWIGGPGNILLSFELFDQEIEITEELLRVAGALAAFSGLYFAVAMLTDSTFREEFLDELTAEMRDSFRARREYLRLRDATVSSTAAGSGGDP
ncbi:MAG: hypothetical protein ACR2N5_06320 [Solirubrobacterales bacterium]